MPGAQPILGVVSTGLGAARAPGFPRYDRIIAICSRYERRGLLLWRDAPPRYRRLRAAARDALVMFPTLRVRRIGSSLAMEMARDYTIHAAILDQLDLRYCPGTCALCDGLAASRADDWPVDHARSRS
jgi:hypothetical protein